VVCLLAAFLFLVSSIAFGWSLSLEFNFFSSLARRFAFSFLIGFVLQTFFLLAASWALGFLSPALIAVSSTVFLALAFLQFKRKNKLFSISFKQPVFSTKSELVAIAFVLLFLFLNQTAVLVPDGKGVNSAISVRGDYPFHLSIASSFALSQNFPPEYPILVGEPLKYSFAMDFASGVLIAGGMDYRSSLVLPGVLIFLCLTFAMVFFSEFFSKKTLFALLFFALFFLNGNYGLVFALNDSLAQHSLSPLISPTQNYSNVDGSEVVLMNFLYSVFLPERSALLGMALSVLVYFLLFKNFREKNFEKKELVLAGVLAGLLPLAHAHSFLSVGVVAAFLFLFDFHWKKWLWFFAPAFIVMLPQVAWLWGRTFFSKQIGWMASNKSVGGILDFWIKNGWATLLLVVPAFLLLSKNQKKLGMGFAVLFVAANIALFQPWEWDNSKIFLHFFLFAGAVAALVLLKLFESKKIEWLSKTAVLVLTVLAIASGVLTVFWIGWGENARYQTFSNEDFALAQWVGQNTPADSLFLTTQTHPNPLSLTGRRIVAGYDGWLWSHGLNFKEKLEDAKKMISTGDCSLMEKYSVEWVFLKADEWKLEKTFENENFTLAYSDVLGNKVWWVNCNA
jgi:hypothetical protein